MVHITPFDGTYLYSFRHFPWMARRPTANSKLGDPGLGFRASPSDRTVQDWAYALSGGVGGFVFRGRRQFSNPHAMPRAFIS